MPTYLSNANNWCLNMYWHFIPTLCYSQTLRNTSSHVNVDIVDRTSFKYKSIHLYLQMKWIHMFPIGHIQISLTILVVMALTAQRHLEKSTRSPTKVYLRCLVWFHIKIIRTLFQWCISNKQTSIAKSERCIGQSKLNWSTTSNCITY